MNTFLVSSLCALVGFIAGNLWMWRTLSERVKDAVAKLPTADARMKAVAASALREAAEAKAELACRIAREKQASEKGDQQATLRRISAALDVQAWPDNMDLAGSVECMMQQYHGKMQENAMLRRRLELVEEAAPAIRETEKKNAPWRARDEIP